MFPILLYLASVLATPPACFLSCTNEVSHRCVGAQANILCICSAHDAVQGCLVDICPYGNFESARDHYVGTCQEHGQRLGNQFDFAGPVALVEPPYTNTAQTAEQAWQEDELVDTDGIHYIMRQSLGTSEPQQAPLGASEPVELPLVPHRRKVVMRPE